MTRGWELILSEVRWLSAIPSQSAIGQWDWGFHTVWGGFVPEDHGFRPQVVGVVNVLKDF